MEKEIWKDIDGYEGYYQVSSMGRVRGVDRWCGSRFTKGKIRSLAYDKKGYQRVGLLKNGVYKTHKVHRLVAEMFHENPKNKPQVNHINMVKDDNRAKNLEWCTQSENMLHSVENGRNKAHGKEHYKAVLEERDVAFIRACLHKNIKHKEIAKIFNVSKATITQIKARRNWNNFKTSNMYF